MPRTTTFELVSDTGYFNPLQIQPRALLSTSFNGLARWLREHLVSFPALIRDEKHSVVILAASIGFEQPLSFFDGDSVKVETTLRVLRGGTRAQLDNTFSGANGVAARVRILLCPVSVDDPDSLGAIPAAFPERILARFAADEIDPGSPDRPMLPLREAVIAQPAIATHVEPFVIHRHHCEVADQWAFYEVAGLVGASREAFGKRAVKDHPELADALGKPVRRFEMELSRPYFWLQPGSVETTLYRHGGSIALVHRLQSDLPGETTYGTIIETF
ncbi:MAG: hypothetical protein AB7P03_15870 [Kofleriaceae bacterium]